MLFVLDFYSLIMFGVSWPRIIVLSGVPSWTILVSKLMLLNMVSCLAKMRFLMLWFFLGIWLLVSGEIISYVTSTGESASTLSIFIIDFDENVGFLLNLILKVFYLINLRVLLSSPIFSSIIYSFLSRLISSSTSSSSLCSIILISILLFLSSLSIFSLISIYSFSFYFFNRVIHILLAFVYTLNSPLFFWVTLSSSSIFILRFKFYGSIRKSSDWPC